MPTSSVRDRHTQRDLAALAGEVLGNFAFMIGDDEPAQPPPGTVWLECRIAYAGPTEGTLTCWCTRGFAVRLAANLLGLEPDESGASAGAEDSLREFMNVLCGHLMTTWYGTHAVFHLSLPTVCERAGPPPLSDAAGVVHCRLSVGGEPFHCVHQMGGAR